MGKSLRRALFAALLLAAPPGAVLAADGGPVAEFDGLVARGRYAEAAAYVRADPARYADPVFFSRYAVLLVNRYARQEGFRAFAAADRSEGEGLAALRARSADLPFVETDLEAELHRRVTAAPGEPHLNFAVGEYLSRAAACGGCFTPRLFTGEPGEDAAYFRRAMEGGVETAWSLFRLGAYVQATEEGGAADAETFYRRALALDPDLVAAHYNLAVLRFLAGDGAQARTHAERALDGYGSDELNADTHHLMARIEEAQGDAARAEAQYRRALELKPWHGLALADFLGFLRERGEDQKYEAAALAAIGYDFANPYTFNAYLDFLADEGVREGDRRVFRALLGRAYPSPREEGTVWYNLGRAADLQGDPRAAAARYRRALDAFARLPDPPADAVESLNTLLRSALERVPAGPFPLRR